MSERKGTRALELWCKRLVRDCPNVRIENMTTSWRDGIAFCALVHHFRPDLIDHSSLKPENIYDNNQLAFSIAEKHLGIPALLDPEDMVANEVPDRLSVLTYLSQFYQRLGHTVNTKANESDSIVAATPSPTAPSTALNMFGKSVLDKCAACDLPVYLAQRLIISQKLYHRRCFRCSKCSGHLNPNNFKNFVGTEFVCDSCNNDSAVSKLLNNNDAAMGMLAFSDSYPEVEKLNEVAQSFNERRKSRPQSILDKINMFEKNDGTDNMSDKLENLPIKQNDTKLSLAQFTDKINMFEKNDGTDNMSDKLENLPIKHTQNIKTNKDKDISSTSIASTSQGLDEPALELQSHKSEAQTISREDIDFSKVNLTSNYESVYKPDVRNTFLKTQLLGDSETDTEKNNAACNNKDSNDTEKSKISNCSTKDQNKHECNVTDDTRLAKSVNETEVTVTDTGPNIDVAESSISIPPRRKKRPSSENPTPEKIEKSDDVNNAKNVKDYPDTLNPFGDDEDEEESTTPKNSSTNPFGSDDEDDDVPGMKQPANTSSQHSAPGRRLISANPFWSDGEEPSDEDTHDNSSTYQSSLATSTPSLQHSTPRRRKAPPPPPPTTAGPPTVTSLTGPPAITVTSLGACAAEDGVSLSSVSSYNSNRSPGKMTPLQKKRAAPTPPDSGSVSALSAGSMENVDGTGLPRRKGPAPGLPLPARRSVHLQLSPVELQGQLERLEVQQLGLERQGVTIEQMIRDKCEGESAGAVPQEEVEELVIQLCELVNEKNDLFRKQTELMYIRRQQRLEQEQADIEHEIRVIQSRPAVNRIDADKAREEQLVSRLVEIVRLRDELVQQLDAERRRERQEDLAIAASIASKRAQRNSESNSSSMKSIEVVATPKKSKVKDKMKKQFKKAKHSLIPKRKDEEKGAEKDKKSKSSS